MFSGVRLSSGRIALHVISAILSPSPGGCRSSLQGPQGTSRGAMPSRTLGPASMHYWLHWLLLEEYDNVWRNSLAALHTLCVVPRRTCSVVQLCFSSLARPQPARVAGLSGEAGNAAVPWPSTSVGVRRSSLSSHSLSSNIMINFAFSKAPPRRCSSFPGPPV